MFQENPSVSHKGSKMHYKYNGIGISRHEERASANICDSPIFYLHFFNYLTNNVFFDCLRIYTWSKFYDFADTFL